MKSLIMMLLLSIFTFGFLSSCDKNEVTVNDELTPEISDNTETVDNEDINNNTENPEPIDLLKSSAKIIEASNVFGLDIFKKLVTANKEENNLFISPFSIGMALTMAYNGAATETKTAMENTLHLSGLTNEAINQSYSSLSKSLLSSDPKVEINVANSIWYRQGFEVEQNFIDVNKNYFSAEVAKLNFADPAAKGIINGWVEDKTNGKIKDLIKDIRPDHVMFLINAIYFKGLWATPFDPKNSFESDFYISDNEQVKITYMLMLDTVKYFSDNTVNMIELPYGQKNYSMILMLPGEGRNIDQLSENLSVENWKNWTSKLADNEVNIQIPKFKMEYDKKLNDVLKEMGMGIAFKPGSADFTNLEKSGQVYIDYVQHKSFIEVNEEGTEAAAATVVALGKYAMPENKFFIANKPFLFAITEKSTGAIIFIGKFRKPIE